MRFSTKRGIVVGLVFVSVLVGLVIHSATGTESALGWRDIAIVCPVGLLEVLAGSRGLAVHAAALIAITLAIALVFGKAFCSWACPTQFVRIIFGLKSNGDSRARREIDAEQSSDIEGFAVGSDTHAAINSATGESIITEKGNIGVSDNPTAMLDGVSLGRGPEHQMQFIKRPAVKGACTSPDVGFRSVVAPLAPVGGKRDGLRFDSRHFILLGAVGSSFAFGFPVFCLICPVGLAFGIVIGIFNLIRFADATWSLVVFPAILVFELVVFRKWCTALCPISALLSLVGSHNRRLNPKVEESRCLRQKGVDCKVCVTECPERVDPHSLDIPECSKCGVCADKCPAQAISFKLSRLIATREK